MNPSVALAKRNVLCYIRDRQSVFFSLMGVLIVVLLYLLFLRNMLIESYPDLPGMDNLVDVWVMSGILGIVPVTTCAGALQTMVEDRTGGRDRDLLVTPMGARSIALGYVLSTFVVGLLMGAMTLVICLVYLVVTGCPLSIEGKNNMNTKRISEKFKDLKVGDLVTIYKQYDRRFEPIEETVEKVIEIIENAKK